MNHLVLNLRSYSRLPSGSDFKLDPSLETEIIFTQSRFLGNIGAPLDFDQDIDSILIEDGRHANVGEEVRTADLDVSLFTFLVQHTLLLSYFADSVYDR